MTYEFINPSFTGRYDSMPALGAVTDADLPSGVLTMSYQQIEDLHKLWMSQQSWKPASNLWQWARQKFVQPVKNLFATLKAERFINDADFSNMQNVYNNLLEYSYFLTPEEKDTYAAKFHNMAIGHQAFLKFSEWNTANVKMASEPVSAANLQEYTAMVGLISGAKNILTDQDVFASQNYITFYAGLTAGSNSPTISEVTQVVSYPWANNNSQMVKVVRTPWETMVSLPNGVVKNLPAGAPIQEYIEGNPFPLPWPIQQAITPPPGTTTPGTTTPGTTTPGTTTPGTTTPGTTTPGTTTPGTTTTPVTVTVNIPESGGRVTDTPTATPQTPQSSIVPLVVIGAALFVMFGGMK